MKKIEPPNQNHTMKSSAYSTPPKLSPKLDLNSTKPRFLPPGYDFGPRTKRMFGLREAVTFYPTPEEFKDPLKYISSIRPEGEKYGICRIVPPKGWKPDFGLDTQKFHFRTRIQKLNSMEGASRSILAYLDQLQKFHNQQKTPFTRVPILDKKPVDLFHLKKEVAIRGGYHYVTESKQWAEVGRAIGHTSKTCTSMSTSVRNIYTKWILPYEEYLELNSTDDVPSDIQEEVEHSSMKKPKRGRPKNGNGKKAEIPKPRRKFPVLPLHKKGEICEICGNYDTTLIICTECDAGYHAYCLTPPMKVKPTSDWTCPNCLKISGNDYGFEDGEERSLYSFQKIANDFKENWFASKKSTSNYSPVYVTEDEVEREFWRLVESPYDDVEVEYGADLHSSHHGSGFPTVETDPLNSYSRCGWNLNNIALLPESLFCNIHNDISGMMIPWLYVGMVFSTFCWHTEDHYTYSVNYHHWGETKTWYGIPSHHADKFEETMRDKVPELFKSNPDLLFHLTTILSPGALVKNGVDVFALDQRPGDFVITFPRGYHAGFNQGFNFCEAVNFALPDWMPYGLNCVQRYQEFRKVPVFSHDELVVTTFRRDCSKETARWLQQELRFILERETKIRRNIIGGVQNLKNVHEPQMNDEQHCFNCNSYCYVSVFTCESCSPGRIACLSHWSELCECSDPSSARPVLKTRFTDQELWLMYSSLEAFLSDTPSPNSNSVIKKPDNRKRTPQWLEKYQALMRSCARPILTDMKNILAEGLATQSESAELKILQEFVLRAEKWIKEATLVTDTSQAMSPEVVAARTLENINRLKKELELLPFEFPGVSDRFRLVFEFVNSSRMAIQKFSNLRIFVVPNNFKVTNESFLVRISLFPDSGLPNFDEVELSLREIDAIIKKQNQFMVDLSGTETLKQKSLELQWTKNAFTLIAKAQCGQRARQRHSFEFNWMIDLPLAMGVVEEGKSSCRVLKERNDVMQILCDAIHKGEVWGAAGAALMNNKKVSMNELEGLFDGATQIICSPVSLMTELLKIYKLAYDFRYRARLILAGSKVAPGQAPKASNTLLIKILEESKTLPVRMPEIKALKDCHVTVEKWIAHALQVLFPSKVIQTRSFLDALTKLWKNVHMCTRPVRNSHTCICHNEEVNWEAECSVCRSQYHRACLKYLKSAAATSNFVCFCCDPNVQFVRTEKRPTFSDVESLLKYPLPVTLEAEMVLLSKILTELAIWRQTVNDYIQSRLPIVNSLTDADVTIFKMQLKSAEGLEIEVKGGAEQLRQILSTYFSTHPPTQHKKSGSSELFCFCRKPFDSKNPMIACDCCNEWFHFSCVNLTAEKVDKIDQYACPMCEKKQISGVVNNGSSNHLPPPTTSRSTLQNIDQPQSYHGMETIDTTSRNNHLRKRSAPEEFGGTLSKRSDENFTSRQRSISNSDTLQNHSFHQPQATFPISQMQSHSPVHNIQPPFLREQRNNHRFVPHHSLPQGQSQITPSLQPIDQIGFGMKTGHFAYKSWQWPQEEKMASRTSQQ